MAPHALSFSMSDWNLRNAWKELRDALHDLVAILVLARRMSGP